MNANAVHDEGPNGLKETDTRAARVAYEGYDRTTPSCKEDVGKIALNQTDYLPRPPLEPGPTFWLKTWTALHPGNPRVSPSSLFQASNEEQFYCVGSFSELIVECSGDGW